MGTPPPPRFTARVAAEFLPDSCQHWCRLMQALAALYNPGKRKTSVGILGFVGQQMTCRDGEQRIRFSATAPNLLASYGIRERFLLYSCKSKASWLQSERYQAIWRKRKIQV
jgi:hypothetical protein